MEYSVFLIVALPLKYFIKLLYFPYPFKGSVPLHEKERSNGVLPLSNSNVTNEKTQNILSKTEKSYEKHNSNDQVTLLM